MKNRSAYYLFMYLLPKNIVSKIAGSLFSLPLPKSIALLINKFFVKVFKIDMSEAELPITSYKSFQELFVRKLKPDLRPIMLEKNILISPCDGVVSEMGLIKDGLAVQAKGKYYSVEELLGDHILAQRFCGGYYCTIYLSPKDYHRFHMPIDGKIIETIYIPGHLWPVNSWAINNVWNLFCINERIVTLFEALGSQASIAHVAVGATMVGKIKLSYSSVESNNDRKYQRVQHDDNSELILKKGEELGRFMFGSTIVLLFERGLLKNVNIKTPTSIKMGQELASIAGTN